MFHLHRLADIWKFTLYWHLIFHGAIFGFTGAWFVFVALASPTSTVSIRGPPQRIHYGERPDKDDEAEEGVNEVAHESRHELAEPHSTVEHPDFKSFDFGNDSDNIPLQELTPGASRSTPRTSSDHPPLPRQGSPDQTIIREPAPRHRQVPLPHFLQSPSGYGGPGSASHISQDRPRSDEHEFQHAGDHDANRANPTPHSEPDVAPLHSPTSAPAESIHDRSYHIRFNETQRVPSPPKRKTSPLKPNPLHSSRNRRRAPVTLGVIPLFLLLIWGTASALVMSTIIGFALSATYNTAGFEMNT